MSRKALLLLGAAFILTRAPSAWLADHPDRYRGRTGVAGDVTLYAVWAERITGGSIPYSEVPVEYPPGSLPFILGPQVLNPGGAYRTNLVVLMLLVDAVGLAGLIQMTRGRGSALGPWSWVVLVPLLGPIAYVRLDLVPAVATIWAIERAAARSWGGAGASLGLGIAAKLYPALLLPASFLVAARRGRLVAGAAVALALALLPFAAMPRGLIRNVLEYHSGRDIQIESVWGLALLVASTFGYDARVAFGSGSFNIESSLSPVLKAVAVALMALALIGATWVTARTAARGDVGTLSAGLAATMALAVGLSPVFSPQFVLWVIAPAAAALCYPAFPIRRPAVLLPAIALLTQILYPFQYHRLLSAEPVAIVILAARDALLLAMAIWVLARLRSTSALPADGSGGT